MDKPAGPTSHDLVARARRVYGERAVGHTGTLDPFATGLLVLLFGEGTRLARFVAGDRKTYHGVARLGVESDTDDVTGTLRERPPAAWPAPGAVEAAVAGFRGRIAQRPPAFSAKRSGGVRSYQRARRGETVALAPVTVEVHRLVLEAYDPPHLAFRCTVSAGTYIRALARDLGEALGTGAVLVSLRREGIGALGVEDAITIDALDHRPPLRPLLDVVPGLPRRPVTVEEWEAVRHGRDLGDAAYAGSGGGPVALVVEGRLAAVAERTAQGLHPCLVLAGAPAGA